MSSVQNLRTSCVKFAATSIFKFIKMSDVEGVRKMIHLLPSASERNLFVGDILDPAILTYSENRGEDSLTVVKLIINYESCIQNCKIPDRHILRAIDLDLLDVVKLLVPVSKGMCREKILRHMALTFSVEKIILYDSVINFGTSYDRSAMYTILHGASLNMSHGLKVFKYIVERFKVDVNETGDKDGKNLLQFISHHQLHTHPGLNIHVVMYLISICNSDAVGQNSLTGIVKPCTGDNTTVETVPTDVHS